MSINIVGISALYHDSSCCILKDGKLVAAAEEERFTRIKNDSSIPGKSFLYCLEEAGLTIADIDYIAYYELPDKKYDRQIWSGLGSELDLLRYKLDPTRPESEIREKLGYEGPIKFIEHHLSHAASSFYFSGYSSAAILTVDGVGEWATTTYGLAENNTIKLFEEVHFPNSIGLLYSTITSYLGFSINSDEYKVMGLAPYGKPVYRDKIREMIIMKDKGQYELDIKYFDFIKGNRMYSDLLPEFLGVIPRRPNSEILNFHKDIAKSIQVVLEEILLEKANYLYEQTKNPNLCMAGGVALNCVANGNVLRKGPFKRLFVQPAANDAGGALGAAAAVYYDLNKNNPPIEPLKHIYLGPEFSAFDIRKLLDATSLHFSDYQNDFDALLNTTAQLLAQGNVIGWFQGKMEFGPRSLGARSILADPRDPNMRDRINSMVKKREGFRPFAPAVLEEKMKEHFDLDHPSPFMLETCQVISKFNLPAITHVDGSARVQTVTKNTNFRFACLLEEFEKITGCPILLNTSFNVKGEPIVCTPLDALMCFISTDIDCLILGDCIIKRSENSMRWLEMKIKTNHKIKENDFHTVYSFI